MMKAAIFLTRLTTLSAIFACFAAAASANPHPPPAPAGDGHFWWKGNLHTHTLWSDGDQFPEIATQWYVTNGYHFLTLSDHNILSRGQRWINPRTNGHIRRSGGMDAVELYIERFGEDWVETRGSGDDLEVRLRPLDEFRSLFERAGQFILIESEEITERAHVVHMNATNIAELIRPQTGDTVEDTIRLNIDAVIEQGEQHGRSIMPHLNHPNFRWAVRAEDMIPVENLQFFEVYNGHRGVLNFGDDDRVDLDRMWDIVLTKRLAEKNLGIVYGLAVDDAHNYENSTSDVSRPGRGWVMVRSRYLTPEGLISAMEAGDFYSSSGVTLKQIENGANRLGVEIDPEPGVNYTIQFIGTRRGYDPSSEPVILPKAAGKIADVTGRWVFVQAVADREAGEQTLRVYDPENDRWEQASIALEPGATTPTGPLYLPSHPRAFPFTGEIKNVRFWHRARTTSEAEADKETPLTGGERDLVAYWDFNDIENRTIRETVGGHDGVLHGNAVETSDRLLRFDGENAYAEVASPSALAPGEKSFTIEMWVKTDPGASGWNLPIEWPGGDRIYVGQDVGEGWNFVVTTDGSRTDTQHGHTDELEEVHTTRRYSDEIGAVLREVEGTRAVYEFDGDEIYVRAKIISSKEKGNPFAEGEREKAWVQPVIPEPGT